MSSIKYRADIDGLRALAVLGVLFFHAGLSFPGGYVGVDIFFVISGFLITSILLRDVEAGKFTYKDFWVRRIRRILPVAFVVVSLSLCVGAYLLPAKEFRALGKSSVFYSIMMANVHFWKDIDYFSSVADYKPLLHTWSLAVEEQFYLLFPSLLLFFNRLRKQVLIYALVVLFILSFILSCFGSKFFPEANFYLLPSRMWELLAGSLLAYFIPYIKLSRWKAEAASLFGLFLMIFSMFFYEKSTPWPSPHALLPVLGAVLFIASGSVEKTWVSTLFSWKPIVYLGLISYSLYLWHWPVLVYAKYLWVEISPQLEVYLCLFSLFLAILSYHFVEQPFRKKEFWKPGVRVWKLGAVLSFLTLAFSLLIYKGDGLPSRFTSSVVMEDIRWNGSSYVYDGQKVVSFGKEGKEKIDFLLIGDSHAMAASEAIDFSSKKYGLKGLSMIKSSLIPTPYLIDRSISDKKNKFNEEFNLKALALIKEAQIKNVFLFFRWNVRVSSYLKREIEGGKNPYGALLSLKGQEYQELTVGLAKESMSVALKRYIQQLSDLDVNVYLIQQVPTVERLYPAIDFLKLQRFPQINESIQQQGRSLKSYIERRQNMSDVLAGLNLENLTVLDPLQQFFPNRVEFMNWYGERSYYRDDHHLTRYGSSVFVSPLIEPVFSKLSELE